MTCSRANCQGRRAELSPLLQASDMSLIKLGLLLPEAPFLSLRWSLLFNSSQLPPIAATSSTSEGSSPPSSSYPPSYNYRSFASASTSTPGSHPVPKGKNTAVLEEPTPAWPVQPPKQTLKSLYRPWDHTRQLASKSAYPSRMGFLIQSLEQEHVQKVQRQRNFPDFKSGDILELRMMVPENQRRQYIYRGVCIARYNKGIRTAFKLYNVFPDGGAVVQHLPLYMPDIQDIKVIGKVQAGSRVKKYHILENSTSKYTFQKQVRGYKEGAEEEEASSSKAK